MAEESILKTKFRQGYAALFYQQWPALTGGLLLGLLSILIVAWSRPWGIVGGIRNWADWLFYGLGLFPGTPGESLPVFFLDHGYRIPIGDLRVGPFGQGIRPAKGSGPGDDQRSGRRDLYGNRLGPGHGLQCRGLLHPPDQPFSQRFPDAGRADHRRLYRPKISFVGIGKIPSQPSGFTPMASLGEKGFDWKTIQPYLGTLVFIGLIVWAYLVFRKGLYGNRRPSALRCRLWNHPAALSFLFCPGLSRPFYDRRGDHRQGHRRQYYHRHHRCGGFEMERLPSGKPLCHPGLLVGIAGGWHHIRYRNGHRRRMRKRNPVAGIRRTA